MQKRGRLEYYYLRNAQGDIVKLIDASGATVVEYTYDTWGKKVNVTGSLAGTLGTLQPFRYRGYVYDEETGFYYLESRYYDPTTGRFISADVLLSTGQGVLGHNAFAYCLDNPVNYEDPDGLTSILSKLKDFFEQLVYGGGGTGQSPWASRDETKHNEWQNPQDQRKSDPKINNTSGTSSNQSSFVETTLVSNEITSLPLTGSALKTDLHHCFPIGIDYMAQDAVKFSIPNGTLYQIEGSINKVSGRYEWIVQGNSITHRMFVKGGSINGIPIKP